MITEEEATRLLKRADPARFDDRDPSVDAAGYLAALRTRSTTVTLIKNEPTTTQPEGRHRWPIIAVAAAAVVAIVGATVVAFAVNNTRSDEQTPSPAAATTVAPATLTPTTLTPTTLTPTTSVVAAAHRTGETVRFAVATANDIPVTFTAPIDWIVADGWAVYKLNTVGLLFDQVGNIYADGCQWMQVDPPVGPTVDDLAAAWENLPNFAATEALDITVDGYAGKQIDFTVPDYNRLDCTGTHFALQYPGEPQPGNPTAPGFWAQGPNQHTQQRIVDVDGTRLVITAWYLPSATPQDRAALDAALASIQIG